jgi:hypothetical protein
LTREPYIWGQVDANHCILRWPDVNCCAIPASTFVDSQPGVEYTVIESILDV